MWDNVDTIVINLSDEFISYIDFLCQCGKPIIINGDLSCSNSGIKRLPDNLTIMGSLHCTDNGLTELPNNLLVHVSLDCSCNNLTSLPDDLKVGGSLFLYYNNIRKEIKCVDESKITMDHEQKELYIRVCKINRIIDNINKKTNMVHYG